MLGYFLGLVLKRRGRNVLVKGSMWNKKIDGRRWRRRILENVCDFSLFCFGIKWLIIWL